MSEAGRDRMFSDMTAEKVATIPHDGPHDSDFQASRPLARVGDLTFLNCAPIRWGLRDSGAARWIATLSGTPAQSAAGLVSGRLDIGVVSLLEYLRHARNLLLLPGLAIGSDGPVRSCHLVTRIPLRALHGRLVALSTLSRTTVLLVRMLLEDGLVVRPRYLPHHQDLDAMLRVAEAAVLIGDDALRLHADAPRGLAVHDVGGMWRDWSGLPAVFAVWAVRREFASSHPDRLRIVHKALLEAVRRARRHPEAVVAAGARESEISPSGRLTESVLADYYQTLDYSLGDRQLAAIHEFAHRAARRGEIPEKARPVFAPGLS